MRTKHGDIKVVSLPLSRPVRVLWTVELEATWRPTVPRWAWTGYAVDSIEACELAMRDYYGPLFDDEATRKKYSTRVISCTQAV